MISLLIAALGFVYADVYKSNEVIKYAIFGGHAVGEKKKKSLVKVSAFPSPIVIPIKKKRVKSFEEKFQELEKLLLEKWSR